MSDAVESGTKATGNESETNQQLIEQSEKLLFRSEWNVVETGNGVEKADFEKNPSGNSGKSSKSRELVATFDNMRSFAKFLNHYPKPSGLFQSADSTRHTLREQSDLVVVVKDITVIRSHITAEFEDGAFIANGKCVGYRMRVNRINTASAFNAIWDALLFAIVGETLLPESFPKELIACIRAKDMTNKRKKNSPVPNYRIELWLRHDHDQGAELSKRVEKLVDQVTKDPDARRLIKFEYLPMKGAPAPKKSGGGWR